MCSPTLTAYPRRVATLVGVALLLTPGLVLAGRTTLSLDGAWRIADSTSATEMPAAFPATVPVPGLANLATPGFKDVDKFISRQNLANRIRSKLSPDEWLTITGRARTRPRLFRPENIPCPGRRRSRSSGLPCSVRHRRLAQRRKVGEYPGCHRGYFKLNGAIRWDRENTLVVRIGAHPAVLPDTYPTGSDFEKIKWTPGIYDSVSLIFCDNPVIETLQVAARIATSEIVVQTKVKNYGAAPATASLAHTVKQ